MQQDKSSSAGNHKGPVKFEVDSALLVPMKPPAKVTATQYKHAFIARTAKARADSGYTQEQIAQLLDIKQDLYKQYESRTPLPHYLVPKFCLATKVKADDLFGIPWGAVTAGIPRVRRMGKGG